MYGKVIISEKFLPFKTIAPTKPDGNVYTAHGINFRLYLDEVTGVDDEGCASLLPLLNLLSIFVFLSPCSGNFEHALGSRSTSTAASSLTTKPR